MASLASQASRWLSTMASMAAAAAGSDCCVAASEWKTCSAWSVMAVAAARRSAADHGSLPKAGSPRSSARAWCIWAVTRPRAISVGINASRRCSEPLAVSTRSSRSQRLSAPRTSSWITATTAGSLPGECHSSAARSRGVCRHRGSVARKRPISTSGWMPGRICRSSLRIEPVASLWRTATSVLEESAASGDTLAIRAGGGWSRAGGTAGTGTGVPTSDDVLPAARCPDWAAVTIQLATAGSVAASTGPALPQQTGSRKRRGPSAGSLLRVSATTTSQVAAVGSGIRSTRATAGVASVLAGNQRA